MKIETACLADAAQVIALWEATGLTRPWNDPQRDFELALQTQASDVLLAWQDRALVGSAMVGFDGHRGWVYYLAVADAHRGRA